MKLFFAILIISFTSCVYAQSDFKGKTYVGKISETCKERQNGGCWIVGYLVLSFEADSVTINYNQEGFCSPEDESYSIKNGNPVRYKWTIIDEAIHIDEYPNFGTYRIQEDKLVGTKIKNDAVVSVVFERM